MSSFPAVVTQEDGDELNMATHCEEDDTPFPKLPTTPFVSPRPQVSSKKKKLVQQSMFGKPLPHFKPKVKVSSYKRKDGTLVKKYTRNTTGKKSYKSIKTKNLSWKDYKDRKVASKETVDLVHSLHISDTLDLIRNSFPGTK